VILLDSAATLHAAINRGYNPSAVSEIYIILDCVAAASTVSVLLFLNFTRR